MREKKEGESRWERNDGCNQVGQEKTRRGEEGEKEKKEITLKTVTL